MSAIATGRIKIVDYNDALSLTGYISSNHPKNQTYDPDNNSYTPNWKTNNLVLTPTLNKLGSTANIITSSNVKSVKWYLNGSTTALSSGGNYILSGAKSHIVTINDNVMNNSDKLLLMCTVVYTDNTTGLDIEHKSSIEFSKFTNGSGVADAVAWAPEGNTFKNGEVDSLVAECYLMKNGIKQTQNLTYQWYYNDPTSNEDQGAGEGWVKIDATTPGVTGHNTSKLTIESSAIEDVQNFKCLINDASRATGAYFDTVAFSNNEDPINISITSTGGDVFKNNIGSTNLTARLFRGTKELDTSGTAYIYRWEKYDDDGIVDSSFNKTGKTITVTTDNVDVSATFLVKISKQAQTKSLKALRINRQVR